MKNTIHTFYLPFSQGTNGCMVPYLWELTIHSVSLNTTGSLDVYLWIINHESLYIHAYLRDCLLEDMKRKPRPTANAPSIDVFPAYDEQPGPNTDDYIRNPDYHAEAHF